MFYHLPVIYSKYSYTTVLVLGAFTSNLFLTQFFQVVLSPFHRQVAELDLNIIYLKPFISLFRCSTVTSLPLFLPAFISLFINCSSTKLGNEGEKAKQKNPFVLFLTKVQSSAEVTREKLSRS